MHQAQGRLGPCERHKSKRKNRVSLEVVLGVGDGGVGDIVELSDVHVLCDEVVTETAHNGHRHGGFGSTRLPGCPSVSLLIPLEVLDDLVLHQVSPVSARVSPERLLELSLHTHLGTERLSARAAVRGDQRRTVCRGQRDVREEESRRLHVVSDRRHLDRAATTGDSVPQPPAVEKRPSVVGSCRRHASQQLEDSCVNVRIIVLRHFCGREDDGIAQEVGEVGVNPVQVRPLRLLAALPAGLGASMRVLAAKWELRDDVLHLGASPLQLHLATLVCVQDVLDGVRSGFHLRTVLSSLILVRAMLFHFVFFFTPSVKLDR